MIMMEQGLPDLYLEDFDAQVAGITIDEVRAAAKVVVRPEKMVSVSVGRADEAQASRVVQ